MDKATMLATLKSNDVNQTLYTLVSWGGGREYYKTCNLWLREPDFVGFCMPSSVSANIAQLDGILPSEARTRCNELCVCEATCATTAAEGETPAEFCGCRSCAPDAAYGAMDQYVMAPPPSARHLLQASVSLSLYLVLAYDKAFEPVLQAQALPHWVAPLCRATFSVQPQATTSQRDASNASFLGPIETRS
jgi:hypothetical protein